MLPAPARMRDGDTFARARRAGRRAGSPRLVVHLAVEDLAGQDVGSPQVGVVAGRQVGPAVVRNRVKRRLRHLLADRLDTLPMGTRLVVRALPPAAGMGHAGLGAELDRLLARAGDGTTR